MNKSESTKELSIALAKAQSELKPLTKNSENPFFKSSYADLSESVEKILPVLSKYGLSVSQGCSFQQGAWVVETILFHSSGEFLGFDWPVMISKQNPGPQDFASSASYARRYAIQAIVSAAASDDDDANHAHGYQKDTKPVYKEKTYTPHETVKKEAAPPKNFAPGASFDLAPLPSDPPPMNYEEALGFTSDPRTAGDSLAFQITFGKHAGKTIGEVGVDVCKSYASWLKDSNTKSGKPMSDQVKTFCEKVGEL